MDPRHPLPAGSSAPVPLRMNPPRATLADYLQPLSPTLDLPKPLVSGNLLDDGRDTRASGQLNKDPAVNQSYRSTGGQQFRVGNIGQNGALYLRPISRQVQPFPTPPMTPPPNEERASPLNGDRLGKENWYEGSGTGSDSRWSPQLDQGVTHKRIKKARSHLPVDPPVSLAPRARAHTLSTLESNANGQPHTVDRGAFQPDKSYNPSRTKSANLLEVSIPHCRLGTPYFSVNGSAILNSSLRSGSSTSLEQRGSKSGLVDQEIPTSAGQVETSALPVSGMRQTNDHNKPKKSQTLRGHVQISPITGKILGATPSGLIAQITSPSSLDYELLSDFFLTFRSYMRPDELVDYLIARLRWAFERNDDFGGVVRVRTFVALRHWILNYFVDDFACDYSMRKQFCRLVNGLCYELQSQFDTGGGNLKVLGELKKCWRRTCALYWDIPNLKSEDATDDILPGGLLGSRKASVDGSISQIHQRASTMGRRLDAGSFGRMKGTDFNRENMAMTPPPDEHPPMASSTKDFRGGDNRHSGDSSADSDENTNDAWCTMPGRRPKPRQKQVRESPSTSGTQSTGIPPSQDIPGFKHLDKPSVSSFDVPRDSHFNLPTLDNINPDVNGPIAVSLPGSLIRGISVHPETPYLTNIQSPEKTLQADIRPTGSTANGNETLIEESKSNIPSNPSVRRLFRPMRRALSGRKNNGPAYYGDGRPRPARPPSEFLDNRRPPLPPPPSNPSSETPTKGRSPVRIDLLAAKISESYKEALKEEATAQRTKDLAAQKTNTDEAAARSSTLNPLKSNPVVDNGEIIGVTTAPEPPRQSGVPHDHNLMPDPKYLPQSNSQDAEDSIDYGSIVHRDNSQTVKSSPTLPFRRLSASVPDSTARELELGEPHFSFQQSKRNHEYSVEPKVLEESQLFDVPTKTENDPTSGTLDVETTPNDTPITSTNDPFYMERLPTRQIRRQPGGDLRAVDHVHSLLGLGPTHSIASESEGSPLISQYLGEHVEAEISANDTGFTSQRGSIQILPTPPLPPLGRSSFELEVAKLAQLPDDVHDDGSRESALRKLEGLEEKQPLDYQARTNSSTAVPGLGGQLLLQSEAQDEGFYPQSTEQIVNDVALEPLRTETPIQLDPILTSHGVLYPPETFLGPSDQVSRHSLANTEDSYSSTPLLQRGLSQPVMTRKNSSSDWLAVSLPDAMSQGSTHAGAREDLREMKSTQGSAISPVVSDQKSNPGLPTESSLVSDTHRSFLLDDDQSLRSQSTVTHEGPSLNGQTSSGMRSFYDDDTENVSNFRVSDILPHPLRHPNQPLGASNSIPEDAPPMPPSAEPLRHIPLQDRVDFYAKAAAKTSKSDAALKEAHTADQSAHQTAASTAHYPFILCHDALTLAQQFTLIERDALSEIDWRELIDLRWRQSPNDTRNWVEYLQTGSRNAADQVVRGGVDICITRFNIMVKWAISEIVLTEDLHERVACIVKYVQIAQYSRRLRNWATMFQITMALVSADVSRLKHTWAAVPDKEKTVLKTIESLIMPTRNFANLRAEMESSTNRPITDADAAIGATGGSIPFIGIYTHDLIYNAQKPAFIKRASGPAATEYSTAEEGRGHVGGADEDGNEEDGNDDDGEQLVNFERHCAAAAIVKGLLRTVEASARYPFVALPQVMSYCLWMAALGDAEIEKRSRGLEGLNA